MDDIIYERVRYFLLKYLTLYVNLFNFVFDKGIFPASWLSGIIKPKYKNGDQWLLENYRPIPLISGLCKLLTSILNTRHNTTNFIEETELLS